VILDVDQPSAEARERRLQSGISALVHLITGQPGFDARRGLRTAAFVSGYEGSPLGGLDLALQREPKVAAADVHHVAAVNEELGATAVWGSQSIPRPARRLNGVVGFWYGKAPGLDRAGDAIRHANWVGAAENGGVVAITGDDPAAKSSTLPSSSEMTLADLCLPVLYPATTQEVIDLGRHGVALSRWSGLWAGLKVVTDVADGFGTADLGLDRPVPITPELEIDGRPWRHQQRRVTLPPHSHEAERDIYYGRLLAAETYAKVNGLNRIVVPVPKAWLGIVAAGTAYQSLRQCLDELGLDEKALGLHGIRVLKMSMLFPLEGGIVRQFARGLEEILVVEEKRSFLESAVRDELYNLAERPAILGKRDRQGRVLVPADGELASDRLEAPLRRILGRRIPADRLSRPSQPISLARPRPASAAERVPFFCSGCPHNRSTVVPEDSITGAGIGCHTMVQLSDDANRRGFSLTQMGGEGAQWIGQAPFSEGDHMFQNLGDGTLFHSASLAIRACVASGVNITYKILYNRAVAMTGGQEPTGGIGVPELTRALAAEGASKIVVCADEPTKYPRRSRWAEGVTVWPRDRLDEAQRHLREVPGVTVLVYDQRCAAEARRLRRRGDLAEPPVRVLINEAVCEGCGDCGAKSNCLSVHPVDTEFGRKTQIHQSSCNKDYSCLEGDCPSFVTVVPARGRPRPKRQLDELHGPLAEPANKTCVDGEYALYLTGIGGTGIVTVNQVLALAATLDGFGVDGLDQTGLSQKAGPVVSHLKIRSWPSEGSRRVSGGHADCLLVFDPLVAVDPKHLAMAAPGRTVAIVSTGLVPTGPMVADPSLSFPDGDFLRASLEGATRRDENLYLDAVGLAERVLGDDTSANVVLVGAAYQRGVIPLSSEAIERAIELNGVAVEANLLAFRWGRVAVAEPQRLEALGAGSHGLPHPGSGRRAEGTLAQAMLAETTLRGELRRLVSVRVSELIRYQNTRCAEDYLRFVEHVAEREAGVVPARKDLSEAVARFMFKLIAYKDEYEVARLYLSPTFRQNVERDFGEGARISYQLHPPILRALGRRRKVRFGSWFSVVFRLLYALRFLRGTTFDPFGHTTIRRTERKLPAEYRSYVEWTLEVLHPATYERAVRLARLPDMVRGYEHIKLANVERFRIQVAELLDDLGCRGA
jgi:indolepyruvate ferredoxin oxidoreductase